MARLIIDLPHDLAEKLRARAIHRGFTTLQEYVFALIEADAKEVGAPNHLVFHDRAGLERLILEGINSRDGGEITPAEWDEKRRKLRERHANPESR